MVVSANDWFTFLSNLFTPTPESCSDFRWVVRCGRNLSVNLTNSLHLTLLLLPNDVVWTSVSVHSDSLSFGRSEDLPVA